MGKNSRKPYPTGIQSWADFKEEDFEVMEASAKYHRRDVNRWFDILWFLANNDKEAAIEMWGGKSKNR